MHHSNVVVKAHLTPSSLCSPSFTGIYSELSLLWNMYQHVIDQEHAATCITYLLVLIEETHHPPLVPVPNCLYAARFVPSSSFACTMTASLELVTGLILLLNKNCEHLKEVPIFIHTVSEIQQTSPKLRLQWDQKGAWQFLYLHMKLQH